MQPAGRRPPGGPAPNNTSPSQSPEEELMGRALSRLHELIQLVRSGAPSVEQLRDLSRRAEDISQEANSYIESVGPPSFENLYGRIDEFARSDRMQAWKIVYACPPQARGSLAWRILALIRGKSLRDAENDPCLKALEKARKLPDEGKEPLLKALAALLFKHGEFTFDLTPYVPTLKRELLEKPFSPTVYLFIACGIRHNAPSSKAQEEIIDLALKLFFQPENFARYSKHWNIILPSPEACDKVLHSANRLMEAKEAPYSMDYANHLLCLHHKNPIWSKIRFWVFEPFLKEHADKYLLAFVGAGEAELVVESLKVCSDPVFLEHAFGLRALLKGSIFLERFFKIGAELTKHPEWETILTEVILPMLTRIREGYMSAEEFQTFKIWFTSFTSQYQPLLLNSLHEFPDFPQISSWMRPPSQPV